MTKRLVVKFELKNPQRDVRSKRLPDNCSDALGPVKVTGPKQDFVVAEETYRACV